jgi:hypothetical protein
MIDAYDLKELILTHWRQLVFKNSGNIKKSADPVPVYVNDKLVIGVRVEDNKIILETET